MFPIESEDALWALVALVVAFGIYCERFTRLGRQVGAAMIIIAVGAVLSNANLVASSSPVYDTLTGPVTSLAIVWLVMSVDLRQLRYAGRAMSIAFGMAVLATAAGALLSSFLFGDALGDDRAGLAGVLTGTYSGGALNFASVARAVELSDSVKAAAMASDNVLTAVWLGMTLAFPVLLRRFLPAPSEALVRGSEGEPAQGSAPLDPAGVAVLIGLGALVMVAARGVSLWLEGVPGLGSVPPVVWLTTIALALGQLPAIHRLRGAAVLGMLCLQGFFVVIGVMSRFDEIAKVGMHVFWATGTVVLTHGVLLILGARLFKIDYGTAAVASQAAVGGPPTAVALAVSKGWRGLVLPGMAVGLLGYAVGTYLGLGVAALVR